MGTSASQPAAGEPISPELVLVASVEQADAARALLPEPRVDGPLRTAPAAAASKARERAPEVDPAPPVARNARTPRRRIGTGLLVVGAALLLVVAGVLLGRNVVPRRTQPGAAPTASTAQTGAITGDQAATTTRPAPPTSPKATTTAGSARPKPRPAPAARTIAWRPRRGVSRYRVDLARRGVAILTIETAAPRAGIPSSWPNAGRTERLTPGLYRWVVRPANAPAGATIATGAFTVH